MTDFKDWLGENNRIGTFKFGQHVRRPSTTMLDAGLWHEKFGTLWAPNYESRSNRPANYRYGAKSPEWVKELDNKRVGEPTRLTAYANQLLDLARAQGGLAFEADVAELSKFVTGIGIAHPIENGFAWHRTLGTPYLPGSGVKGLTLAYARDWLDIGMDELRAIFGTAIGDESKGQKKGEEKAEFEGAVVFFDAVPVAPPVLTAQILTPHGEGSGAPKDAGPPKPLGFLAVKSGRFLFALAPARGPADLRLQQCRKARYWLKGALQQIGAGAKTKSGYGRFEKIRDIPVQPPETLSATTL